MQEKESKVNDNQNVGPFNQYEFIKNIYECELKWHILRKHRIQLFQQQIEIRSEIRDYDNTNFYKKYITSKKQPKEVPPEPRFERYSIREHVDEYLVPGLIIGGIFDLVLSIISVIRNGMQGRIYILPGIILALAIILVGIVLRKLKLKNNYTQKVNYRNSIINNNKAIKNYNDKLEKEFNKAKDDWQAKKEMEINEKEKIINLEIEKVKVVEDKVYNTLLGLYNLKINNVYCLHPNYQGLATISVIYGYFETGRCSQLEGHEGAYNLYEDEKMKGLIIEKLDDVSKQLGRLQASMIYVENAIEECNEQLSELKSTSNKMINSVNNMNDNVSRQLGRMSNQMVAVEENSANSAYYIKVGAQMETFNTIYNLLKN